MDVLLLITSCICYARALIILEFISFCTEACPSPHRGNDVTHPSYSYSSLGVIIFQLDTTMENVGRSTLQDNFAKITGSSLDPGMLADELYERRLINKPTVESASDTRERRDKRLHDIVMAVMDSGKKGGFRDFVEAVKKDEASEWLAQLLIGKL